jgi:hypothetical protein
LFEGKLTDEEINQGFNTGPLNTYDIKMKSIVLTDGVLKISFEDNVLMESLSSAQSSVFYTSIKKTAQQFPEIKKVVLLSNEENGYDVTLNIETEYGDIYLVSTLIDDMTGDLSRYMEAVKIELDSSAQTIEDKISLSLQKLFDIETLEYGQSGYQNLLYESDLNVVDVVTVDGTTEVKISGSLIGSGSVANVFIPMQITETIEQYTDNYIIKLNDSEQAWRCAFDTTGSCI